MKHNAIVNFKRLRGLGLPARLESATFKKRIAIWVEKRAAIGRQHQVLMSHSSMDSTERGEQTCPSVTPSFQHLFAIVVSDILQLLPQGGDGVVIVIQSLSQVQQATLFCGKQKNKPH